MAGAKGEGINTAISAGRYERLELIGTGSFGEVYRGWDREDGLEVAIKVIDLENVEDDITEIHQEVAALAQCKSSNITEYYASVMLPGTTELLIVMELMAGSVNDLLDVEGSALDEQSIAFILREVLKALIYLHNGHRIHRDVKSANVLLSAHGEVKISDFGVSGQLSKTVAFKRKTFVGSPFWMAPEVIRANTKDDGYTETADIWSLGITAYEMATGRPPHADLHPMRALFLIPAENAPRLEGPFSQEFKSFVAQCLQKDPSLRPSAKTLLHHPFLAGPHDSGKLAELVQLHAENKRKQGNMGGRTHAPSKNLGAKWDFDTIGPGTVAHRGTIKSHQINSFTVRDSTWGSSFAQRQLQSWGEASELGSGTHSYGENSPLSSETGFNEGFSPIPSPNNDSTQPLASNSSLGNGLPKPNSEIPGSNLDAIDSSQHLDPIPEEEFLEEARRKSAGSESEFRNSQSESTEILPNSEGSDSIISQNLGTLRENDRSDSGGQSWLAGLWRGRKEDPTKSKEQESTENREFDSELLNSQNRELGPRDNDSEQTQNNEIGNGFGDTVQINGTMEYGTVVERNEGNQANDPRENEGNDKGGLMPAFLNAAENRTLSAMLSPPSEPSNQRLDLHELLFGGVSNKNSSQSQPLSRTTRQVVALLSHDSQKSTSLSPVQINPSPGFENPTSTRNNDLGALGNFLMTRWNASASHQNERRTTIS